ncbi:MAG: DUF1700 domain-containing protein [Clostridia bacterium]|nr:DUF1700 domain-containing protein [Clostridia bacterium]MBQ5488639.1 DUF1700 domain-containing protein [Clostridia bacterium]
MNKQEFISELEKALAGLPKDDVLERLSFYGELIDDRVEDGLSEEEAVAEAGPVDELAKQILADIPLQKLVRERIKPQRRMGAWEIVLLVLGFPLWFPLLVVALVLVLCAYVVIWALIVCLWAVFVSFIAGAVCGVAGGVIDFFRGYRREGVMIIGAGLLFAGLSVFMFFACRAATKGAAKLTKKIALGIKSLFVRKEK